METATDDVTKQVTAVQHRLHVLFKIEKFYPLKMCSQISVMFSFLSFCLAVLDTRTERLNFARPDPEPFLQLVGMKFFTRRDTQPAQAGPVL